MIGFVVVVQLEIRADLLNQALPLIIENARRSVEIEPECHRFDVTQGKDDPHQILLYEIYSDEAAFNYHYTLPHVQEYLSKVRPMFVRSTLQKFLHIA